MNLSDDVDKVSYRYLKTFSDWKTCRNDIKNSGQRPPRGSAAKLGCFSIVRDQQWAVMKEHLQQFPVSTISSRTRSKTAVSMAETEHDDESEDESMRDGDSRYSSPSGSSRAEDVIGTPDKDSHPAGDPMDTDTESDTHRSTGSGDASGSNPSRSNRTISEADLAQIVTRGSDISVANADMYPPSLGEEVVNVAAVTFLRVLTMWCPGSRTRVGNSPQGL